MSTKKDIAVIILAAGLGSRMKSPVSKVLHKIGGKTIIERTCQMVDFFASSQTIIVTNKLNQKPIMRVTSKKYDYPLQVKAQGTADAVKIALKVLKKDVKDLAMLYGDDNVFFRPDTFEKVYSHHIVNQATITFLTLKQNNSFGLGRVYRRRGMVVKIVEEKDATPLQKKIKEVNNGLYFFKKNWLEKNIKKITHSKITQELYLTDLIEEAYLQRKKIETYMLEDNNQFFAISTKNDLKKANDLFAKRVHFMGIRGAGASAVANIAKLNGFIVDGCDKQDKSAYDTSLKSINIKKEHNPSHIANVSTLIASPAILKSDSQNEEISKAKKQGVQLVTWQKFQGAILQRNKFVIAVAGSYGKSTTTAMIAKVLTDNKLDPTCEIGAKILDWQSNFRVGKSNYYVCEADEYNNNFLNYHPDIAVILNAGWDHPDYFKSKKEVINSFRKFIARIKKGGTLLFNQNSDFKKLTEGIRSDIKVVKIKDFSPYKLSIIGDFRKINANAALTVASLLNIDTIQAKKSIETFKGVARRLEYKGQISHVKIFDDYAVQPITIQASANALSDKFKGGKMVLVFEPHTFSRINTFFEDFVKSFKNLKADKILITEVYPAREKGDRKKLARILVSKIGSKAKYSGSIAETAIFVRDNLKNYNVVCSMGAGDIYKLYDFLNK